jgi:hypothetical protein
MTLFFIPEDKSMVEFGLYPDPLKTEQQTGPVTVGNYEIGLLAWGYKAEPGSVKAKFVADRVTDIAVSLKPQGILGGQIFTGLKEDDLYWGFLSSLRKEKKVTAITLAGNGIERKIIPRHDNQAAPLRDIINNRDYFWKDFFIFFDLPKGRYELKVEAAGCRAMTRMVDVDPKIIHAPLKINLAPADLEILLGK